MLRIVRQAGAHGATWREIQNAFRGLRKGIGNERGHTMLNGFIEVGLIARVRRDAETFYVAKAPSPNDGALIRQVGDLWRNRNKEQGVT